MYADREEEEIRRRSLQGQSRRRYTRSPSVSSVSRSVSRSLSRSRSPSPSRSRSRSPRSRRFVRSRRSPSADDRQNGDESRSSAADRERELQERLRKRAMMSKRSSRDVVSTSRSSRSPISERRSRDHESSSRRHHDKVYVDEDDGDGYEERRRRKRLIDSDSHEKTEERNAGSSQSRHRRRSSGHDSKDAETKDGRKSKRDRSHWSYSDDDDAESASSSVTRRRRTRPSEADERYTERAHSRRRYDSPRGGYYGPPPPAAYYRPYDRYAPPPYHAYPNARRGPHDFGTPPPEHRRRAGRTPSPDLEDYEMRSIFCQQLASRLTQRDLGEFIEDKLGEGTVLDVKIVMDKITGRSKGVGYVELKDEALVEKALDLSGTSLYGVPIIVQKTDAARNRAANNKAAGEGGPSTLPNRPSDGSTPAVNGEPIRLDAQVLPSAAARVYVGNIHFSLGEEEIQSVFEPFGKILKIDLHREPGTQKSKGFAFVQYISAEAAEKAIEHMNGFELTGRNIKVSHVNAAKNAGTTTASSSGGNGGVATSNAAELAASGATATLTSAFDEGGGGGLTATSRAALMEKLARIEPSASTVDHQAAPASSEQQRPASIPQAASSRGVLLKNMFNPEEEDERGWDKELAEDIKEECEKKYGKIDAIKVDDRSSSGEVWIRFIDTDGAQKAIDGLNGRFFGGRSITASFISEGFLSSMLKN